MVEIKALEKFAAKDFPGTISSTVFLGGCNFRCPFCHNADLVLRPESLPGLSLDLFLCFLDARRGWLEGVCVTGGEPLLQDHLEDLLSVIKERELLVKLDTNGSRPDRLEALLGEGLVDSVAMDVKAPLDRYREVTRSAVAPEDIRRSIDFIKGSGREYMFRTTVVPKLVGPEDVLGIARELGGARLYQVQQFFPQDTIEPRYRQVAPFDREAVLAMADSVRSYFDEVRVEGV
ncbi:MAG: anaerobic ribonucleoside-triphosphate reductase activating protein [Candidatus Aminicenantes bacterium]|nr:anaerobic ribonucleoside-triphosphate reductase activating protein [Candidatus Aminicenantes bacterium]